MIASPFTNRHHRRPFGEEAELHEKLFTSIEKRFDSLGIYLPSIDCHRKAQGTYQLKYKHFENENPCQMDIHLVGVAMIKRRPWSSDKGLFIFFNTQNRNSLQKCKNKQKKNKKQNKQSSCN